MEIKSHSLSHQDLFILVCRSVYLLESHLELIQYTHLTIEVSNRISLIQTQLSFRVKVLSTLSILLISITIVLIIILIVPTVTIQIKSHHSSNPDQDLHCSIASPQTKKSYTSVENPFNIQCNKWSFKLFFIKTIESMLSVIISNSIIFVGNLITPVYDNS